ncbi:MAG: hypothetical protein GXX94_06470 [Chloroflexi bacterium]|nr:hypothetical protein [Chloroflexota bacterium]
MTSKLRGGVFCGMSRLVENWSEDSCTVANVNHARPATGLAYAAIE